MVAYMVVKLRVQRKPLDFIDNTVAYFKIILNILAEICGRNVVLLGVTEYLRLQSS
jgi:hypothetical protein